VTANGDAAAVVSVALQRHDGFLKATNDSLTSDCNQLSKQSGQLLGGNHQLRPAVSHRLEGRVACADSSVGHGATQDQFAYAGTEVTFSVSAYGTEPIRNTSGWRGNVALSNGTSRLLTLANVRAGDDRSVSGRGLERFRIGDTAASLGLQFPSCPAGIGSRGTMDRRHDADVNPIVKVDWNGSHLRRRHVTGPHQRRFRHHKV
jgi:hypothetical protein